MKVFVIIGAVFLALVASVALFWDDVKDAGFSALTADMFVAADTDAFDPGLPVGASFPPIKAVYQGREIYDVGDFIRDKGMIFVANRSADW